MEVVMDRRAFLATGAGIAAVSALPAFAEPGWRRYRLTTEIDLSSPDAPAELWIPVFESMSDYQKAQAPVATGGGRISLVRDARYQAPLAHVSWAHPGGDRTVKVVQTVSTRDRRGDGVVLTAEEQRFWTAPVASLPTDGIVGETAHRIVLGRTDPKVKTRAIYDWVVDNTFRDAATRGCGVGGIDNMLRSGFLGGKCADINSLMVGLCRAAGLPARDAYGVRLGPSQITKVLGTSSADSTHAQHCRAEVWLQGEGWFPVDPADVRKVVLDGKAAVDSPLVKAERERLFGSWEMNWAAYNHATDIALPGAPQPPRENFLMYPLAITPQGELDQLDADTFKYRLTSEVVA
jgi:transglutaminase-like putative cysteine protease